MSCALVNHRVRHAAQIIIGQCYLLESSGVPHQEVAEIKRQALQMDAALRGCANRDVDGGNDGDE